MRCPLTRSAGNALSVVSWVMGTANRVKGRAVVNLSVDATNLLETLCYVSKFHAPDLVTPHLRRGRGLRSKGMLCT